MSGSAEFAITIDTSPKVAVGTARPGKAENNEPQPKPDQRKASAVAPADHTEHAK